MLILLCFLALPCWAFHGDADTAVNVSGSRDMIDALVARTGARPGDALYVSGTIGAMGGNGIGVAGVNWAIQIVPLKFLTASGSGTLSNAIKAVEGVSLLELGIPEAMWQLRVKDLMALVTMDSHGNSLHAEVEKTTGEALKEVGAGIK